MVTATLHSDRNHQGRIGLRYALQRKVNQHPRGQGLSSDEHTTEVGQTLLRQMAHFKPGGAPFIVTLSGLPPFRGVGRYKGHRADVLTNLGNEHEDRDIPMSEMRHTTQ